MTKSSIDEVNNTRAIRTQVDHMNKKSNKYRKNRAKNKSRRNKRKK